MKILSTIFLYLLANYSYSQSIEYKYDKVNRLIEVKSGCKSIQYIYDKNGNRKESKVNNISVSASVTNITCNSQSNNGSIALISSSSYSYLWSTGQTTSSINNLPPGNYSVTITDNLLNYSCIKSFIVQPPITNDSINVVTEDASCFGYLDGKARVDIITSAPSANYQFKWNIGTNATFSSIDSIIGIPAGDYSVTVKNTTDNCTQQLPFTIVQPQKSITSITAIDNVCPDDTKGSITLTVRGNPSAYIFNWTSTNINGTISTPSLSFLNTGVYHLSVKENFGNRCVLNDSVVINTNRPHEILDIETTRPTCDLTGLGTAEAIVTGPSNNYSYQWFLIDPVQQVGNNSNFVLLEPGNYALTVTENTQYGCVETREFIIEDPLLTDDGILVYPNPTTGLIKIDACRNSNSTIVYTVMNVLLQKLDEGIFFGFPAWITLDKFPKGIYLVTLFHSENLNKPLKVLRVVKL